MTGQTLAVVGGSGIYQLPGLTGLAEHSLETPFGRPSDAIIEGTWGSTRLLFLPRHGRGHSLSPSQINYRANVCALKQLGATHLVSLSAVGSMREKLCPGEVVIVDQYLDFTRQRANTFFDEGVVAHVSFADPVCSELGEAAAVATERALGRVHRGGTYVCIEGPQFSTRAESHYYRKLGVSVIGMTAMPEAKLAREAELPYATIALITDYDCWREGHEEVSLEQVLSVLRDNTILAQKIVRELAGLLPDVGDSPATNALEFAVLTHKEHVSPERRARLAWLLDRYWGGPTAKSAAVTKEA